MAREVITTRAHGIDISRWQETYIYAQTWGQVDFVIQKMTEGLWWDTDWGKLWDQGTSQVAIRGMYHYQRSGLSWKAQADNILEMVERVSPRLHIIALDVEKINNTLDKTYFTDSMRILDYLSVNSDRKVILYINPDVFNIAHPLMLKNYGQSGVKWLFDYPMWLAQYWWTPDPNKQPATPKLRGDWDIWQYTDKGDLKNAQGQRHYGSPDLDVFNGTVEQMRVWANVDAPPPPPPPATITIEGVTVKLSNDSEVNLK
jgi:GH25 family lysozyme M1 (1,4-beta-N-acetylmuramidase)